MRRYGELLIYPNLTLSTPAKKITFFASYLDTLESIMTKKMLEHKGVGISAPQLGISLSAAIIGHPDKDPMLILNPVITAKVGSYVHVEGCLSLPEESFAVTRYRMVIVRYQDKLGYTQTRVIRDPFEAVIIQHEVDHLNGVTLADKA